MRCCQQRALTVHTIRSTAALDCVVTSAVTTTSPDSRVDGDRLESGGDLAHQFRGQLITVGSVLEQRQYLRGSQCLRAERTTGVSDTAPPLDAARLERNDALDMPPFE
jgi:hypothetical protein